MQAPAGEGDDPLTGARVTVVGRFQRVSQEDGIARRLLSRFLARHPEAEAYAGFADFAIHRMTMESIHLVAGFGRIARLAAADLLVPPNIAEAFETAETALLNSLRLPGTRLVAVDPDGVDVLEKSVKRVCFPRRSVDPGEVESLLAELS
jgi:hypothetical protein